MSIPSMLVLILERITRIEKGFLRVFMWEKCKCV